jgi:hypothetical protein
VLAPAVAANAATASGAAPGSAAALLTVSGGGVELPVVTLSSARALVSFHLGDTP